MIYVFRLLSVFLNPFLWLLVASIALLRFQPGGDFAFLWTSAALAGVIASVFGMAQAAVRWSWSNEALATRIQSLAGLLESAEHSVVIVTGSLHPGIYAAPAVIAAARRLPRECEIQVFHERELDYGSSEFVQEMKQRNAAFVRLKPYAAPHGVIVDERHCQIQETNVPDDAVEKSVRSFPFDEARARSFLSIVRKAATTAAGA